MTSRTNPGTNRRFLIPARQLFGGETSAIRNCRNSHGINHIQIPNRDKTGLLWPADQTLPSKELSPVDEILIETLAIRIARKSHRISHIQFSNRDKTGLLWPADQTLPSKELSPVDEILIETLAIRIARKSHRISHIQFSNRDRTGIRPGLEDNRRTSCPSHVACGPPLPSHLPPTSHCIPNRNNSPTGIAATL
jgi:hypothetical protein